MEAINECLKNVAKVKELIKSYLANPPLVTSFGEKSVQYFMDTSGFDNALILLEKTEELLSKL